MKRNLVLQMPVIHQGYLDILDNNSQEIERVYIIGEELSKKLIPYAHAIRPLEEDVAKKILQNLGYEDVEILKKENIAGLKDDSLIMVEDDASRALVERHLKGADIKWLNVFLKRDRSSVFKEEPSQEEEVLDEKSISMIKRAYTQAEKSSDQWRQVGAVLLKDGKVILEAYNQGTPSDHTPYQIGDVRDYMEVGERPDLSGTIHAEQQIISRAAKAGISLDGTKLFITHFPCSACAKLIVASGIGECYFGEGSSNLEGKMILDTNNIKIYKVKI